VGRSDDTIVLLTGENANPLPIELTIRRCPPVREVVVVGEGRAQLGLLVFRNEDAVAMSDEYLLDQLWPFVQAANAATPAFARIAREAIAVLPPGISYAITDKGTAIRKAVVRQFSDKIDEMYRYLEGTDMDFCSGMELSEDELQEYVHKVVETVLHTADPSITRHGLTNQTDLFELGVDSLSSIAIWRRLVRDLSTGGAPVSRNVVFEHPTVNALARHLYELRIGDEGGQASIEEEMKELIAKYSSFSPRVPETKQSNGEVIVSYYIPTRFRSLDGSLLKGGKLQIASNWSYGFSGSTSSSQTHAPRRRPSNLLFRACQ
jgi:hypothetical protein